MWPHDLKLPARKPKPLHYLRTLLVLRAEVEFRLKLNVWTGTAQLSYELGIELLAVAPFAAGACGQGSGLPRVYF